MPAPSVGLRGAMSSAALPTRTGVGDIFLSFLRLGLTSFGGPIAHLGYFHESFVRRRQWLDEASYADLVALCQFLPGPASSQVGIGIGLMRAGLPGALAAWCGFTLPSAAALILFGLGITHYRSLIPPGLLHGLVVVAVAVVAQALWSMARRLCPELRTRTIAVLAALLCLAIPTASIQLVVIALGGVAGLALLGRQHSAQPVQLAIPVSKGLAIAALVVFAVLLVGQPLVALTFNVHALLIAASFYRTGALVFGGGHVVLPLLQGAVVNKGWVSNGAFLAGYGAAQAVPGPLFSFAAYLGTVMAERPNGVLGAGLCLIAIYLPSFLLLTGALPFWNELRCQPAVRRAMAGINAAVVGLLLAALYNPVWLSAVHTRWDVGLALAGFALLTLWKVPPVAVVVASAAAGWLLAGLPLAR